MIALGRRSAAIWGICAAAALGNASCSAPRADREDARPGEETGALLIPLVTTGPSGAIYRLEDAVFSVKDAKGRSVAELATETTPGLEVLSTELQAGHYTVALGDGWTLERTYVGITTSVTAARVRQPARHAIVTGNEDESVLFSFGTQEEPVAFGKGVLGVPERDRTER